MIMFIGSASFLGGFMVTLMALATADATLLGIGLLALLLGYVIHLEEN